MKTILVSLLCLAFLQTHVLACNGTVCKPGPTIYAYDENGNVVATAQGDPSCAFGIEGPSATTPATPAPQSHKKHRDRDRILAFAAVMAVGVTVSIAWGKSHERKAAHPKVSLFTTSTNGATYEFSRR